MRAAKILLAAAMLLIVGLLAFKDGLLSLPSVRADTPAGEQFQTGRAVQRLARILGDERPHPMDSAANDAVRARIVGELGSIGLTARITDDFACNGSPERRGLACGRVRNILATIGPPEGEHLLLVSHYDSTPVGPGAADDGIGVAVMLEVAAQLAKAGPRRPVTFLFNEGEEAGLLGARSFLARDPLAGQVGSLVNLEARGVEGPAIMFETSTPNGAAVRWFARSVGRPVANSLATDFYKLIPNSTDVKVFEQKPWTILNFAVIGNETRYHSPGDTLAALSRRSLQHMGDQALALARDHARGRGAGKRPAGGGSAIFADLLGRGLVTLPAAAGAAVLAALLAALSFLAWRQRTGLGRAVGAVLLALIGSAGLAFAAHAAVGLIRPGEFWRGYPLATSMAIGLTALLVASAALLRLTRTQEQGQARVAFWLLFVLLGAGLALAAPGAIIFFLLAPALAVAGMLLGPRLEHPFAIAAALALLILWAPLIALVETLLDYDNGWIFAPLFAILLLPTLIELRSVAAHLRNRAMLGVLGCVTIAAWAAAALLPAYSANRKQPFGIEYAMEGDGRGRWLLVNDGAPLPPRLDEAGGGFTPGSRVRWSGRPRWSAAAPAGLAPVPGLDVVGDRSTPGGRLVSIRLRTAGAETVTLFAPPSARLRAVRAGGWQSPMGGIDDPVADRVATDGSRDYALRCHGRSCDNMTFDLLLGASQPVGWTLIASRSGLPPAARPLLAARPANAAPQYNPDASIATATLRF